MAIEYYTKLKSPSGNKIVGTFPTSAAAVKHATELQKLHPKRQYAAFYSEDAVAQYEARRAS